MMTSKERREMIYSSLDAFAEKFAIGDDVRDAVADWDVTPGELTFRFGETLRKFLPVSKRALADSRKEQNLFATAEEVE
jgi:hypothetical protein